MDWNQRLSILRDYESACYSVCFFLLQCETMASEAAQNALIRLAQNDAFFQADSLSRQQVLRSESMKCSIYTKRQRC
ncbi:hypothetical protein [Paenibacillus thalictri]|uniref:Uncharacterized protein n=1 Tax=Paenibacillus thalictri TaxID=2527873 RepID=A0A4Q9DP56_9BACL|nr:hypothetical protein [Paenibacillus thalictri]TBL77886.1 hypothetical protein EYB31_17285 [Paenibacillus thalictri]